MINLNKKIFLFLFIMIIYSNALSSKIEIIYKINNDIITSIDIENEKKFLIFLNPNLKNLSLIQIENISKDSLKNRKIKEIELEKFFNIEQENMGKKYVMNFISNSNFENLDNLKLELNKVNLSYQYLEKNFLIDNIWREYIFERFKSKIKIDKDKLKNQIKNQNNQIEEINLSEILFELKPNIELNKLSDQIYNEIEKSGFEAAASIYSISDSKNFGGKLGWIKSNQISEKIYNIIKNSSKLTTPIKTKDGYLILKINDKRESTMEINLERELSKLINSERQKELNKLGYIYFNKIKKRTFISEN
ncbi:peptidylprolyl isomerase [Candidatus Pelagibacter sp.]|nr:peptidylprolyl isomerase [Candidatus Pelagibacter sp.]